MASRKKLTQAPAARQVVGISLGPAAQDFAFETRFLGQTLKVQRLGAGASLAQAARLVREWDERADAFGIGIGRDVHALDPKRSGGRDIAKLADQVRSAPLSTGQRLADILLEWAVRHAQAQLGPVFSNAHGSSSAAWRTRSWHRLCLKARPTCTLPTRCCSSAYPSS